jgi:hypothetical protein
MFLVARNIKIVNDIENARKSGTPFRKKRSLTPRKTVKRDHCKKFKNNPLKFFSEPPCGIVLKSMDFKDSSINNLNVIRDFRDTKDDKEFFLNTDKNIKYNHSASKIHPFSFNNEPLNDYESTNKSQENQAPIRGRLNEIISRLNIEEQ